METLPIPLRSDDTNMVRSCMIRPARRADIAAIAVLFNDLARQHDYTSPAGRQVIDAAQRRQRLAAALDQPAMRLLVADQSGVVAGAALAGLRAERDRSEPKTVSLMRLFVVPCARGRGIGRALLLAVHEWAAGCGAQRIDVDVAAENDDARRLYQRCGFERRFELWSRALS